MKVLVTLLLIASIIAPQTVNGQKPPLPSGLRFDINYRPWYLEGMPHEPVEYLFKIQLLGTPAALGRIKSVRYDLPADESRGPRVITHRVESKYYVEGSMPVKDSIFIIAVIRMKNGKRSSHTILLQPNK